MSLQARRRGGNGLDAWPGYVDALSTLLMVTIFVLLVFVLSEAFLSAALSGSNHTVDILRNQIAQLSDVLSLQKTKIASLNDELASLNAALSAEKSQNASLTSQLASAQANAADSAKSVAHLTASQQQLQAQLSDAQAEANAAKSRIAALQGEVAAPGGGDALAKAQNDLATQKTISEAALNQVDLLNQQIAALRMQLAVIAQALDAAAAKDKADNVQIVDLGKQLNAALAQKVEDLQAYRSEFFGDLRKALAGEPNIKIVGDRFVFESDVLFPVDQATLTAQGQQNIADVAKAINAIAGKIPATINWVLSVDGYADQQKITGGPYRSNFDLSAARALAVLHLLIADGVPENRLVAAGFGAEHPISAGTTPQDFAQNRRIEFRLTSAD